MTDDSPSTYIVEGMSCGHCVASVSEEVSELDGVMKVSVDLATGRVEVVGAGFSDETVRAAVEEAGYRVAGRA